MIMAITFLLNSPTSFSCYCFGNSERYPNEKALKKAMTLIETMQDKLPDGVSTLKKPHLSMSSDESDGSLV